MKILPIKDNYGGTDAEYMYITASDSWGNEEQNIPPVYDAIAVLTDSKGVIKKRLTVNLAGEDYANWDCTNQTVLQMFLDKYDFLKLI